MKAITVGSATIDVIATVDDSDIERMTLHNVTASFLLLEPGRKVDATSVITQTGGGAVNAAVALRRLGFDVSALIKVGADHNAEKLYARLREEGIGTELVSIAPGQATAVSVMIASHDRNAAIFTHRGANGFLVDADIARPVFDGADLVYVTNLSNESADRFPDIVARAKDAGAFVAANPGIRQMTQKTAPLYDSLCHVDMFSCNRREASALVPALVDRTGWDRQSAEQHGDDGPVLELEGFRLSVAEFARRLHSLGPRFVTVTDGVAGAYLSDGKTVHFQPAIKAKVVGTAGAGDAFTATLTAGLVQGLDPDLAMRRAARNAASVVGYVDTQTGLLNAAALAAAEP
jgi:ribokinase